MRYMKEFTVAGLLPIKTAYDPACRFTDRYGTGGSCANWDVYILEGEEFHWIRYTWTAIQARREAKSLSYRMFTAVKVVNSEANTVEFFAYGKKVVE